MGSLRTEHGGKLEVSRVHSRDAVYSIVKGRIQGHNVHEIYRNQVRRQKIGEKKPSCPKKDTHGMRKDNRERLLAEDE